MKKVLPILLILAVVAVAVFFASSKNKSVGAMSFELKFKQGQVDKYRMTMDMVMKVNAPGMPGGSSHTQKANMSGNMTQTVESINPDGSANVKYSVTDMKMTMPGAASNGRTIPDMTYTATIGKDGKMLDAKGLPNSGAMAAMGMDQKQLMGQMSSYQLPKKPVSVGETWKDTIDMPIGGAMEVTCTLAGDNESIGKAKAAKITSEFNYKGDLANWAKKSGSAAMFAGMKGKIDMNGTGAQYFDRSAGKMVKVDADIKMKMDMEMPAGMSPAASSGPSKMQMDMTMNIRMDKVN